MYCSDFVVRAFILLELLSGHDFLTRPEGPPVRTERQAIARTLGQLGTAQFKGQWISAHRSGDVWTVTSREGSHRTQFWAHIEAKSGKLLDSNAGAVSVTIEKRPAK